VPGTALARRRARRPTPGPSPIRHHTARQVHDDGADGCDHRERRHYVQEAILMSGQEQQRPHARDDEPDEVPVPTAPQTQAKDDDVDAILDEIDEVLESNAEEFVKGFVQKGGQ
jgi:ubiquitin-like protein Pup